MPSNSDRKDKKHHQPTAYKGLKAAGVFSLFTGFAVLSMEMYDKTPSRAARRLWQSYGVHETAGNRLMEELAGTCMYVLYLQ